MITKRDTYDDEILFFCETCREEFTIEGYVEYVGDGEEIVIPAVGTTVLCPNDKGWHCPPGLNRRIIASHDVSYYPGGGA